MATMTASPARTAASPPALKGKPLERVARIKDVIAKGGDEAQKIRRLPQETVDTLIDEGFFRFTLPPELGGENATINETIEILEAISAIDGSVGWNVMLGSEINAMAAGGMPKDLAQEVYLDNPRVIMCGGGGPGSTPSRALRQEDGGYRVWGETTFISGCHNAEWCFMAAPIIEDGKPKLDPTGQPIVKMWFLHKSQYQIMDTWDVAGLRGSGSHNVRAEGAYVAPKWLGVDLMVVPALYDNPVFRVPVPLRLAYNKAAVAIGVARGALDAFVDLAQNKVPMLSPSKLMDRPIAQHRMGEAEGMLRAARAFLMESMAAVDDELRKGRESPSAKTTQIGRLACVHAADASMKAVDLVHNAGGTSAMYMKNPLERRLRDAHGCATHRWVAHPLFGDLGRIFLGHEPSPEFAGEGAGPVLGGLKK